MTATTPLPPVSRRASPLALQHTVRAAVAPVLGEARIASTLTSQLVAGDVVLELERHGDWLRVRGADAYEGWLHRGYVEPWRGDESSWAISLDCRVRTRDGAEHALPLSGRIAPGREVIDGDWIRADERAARFPADAAAVAHSAASLYCGASYLWGGVTPWGCDCSGFVQRVFLLHGVDLPRDAWQQAELGSMMSVEAASHAPADLLFFSDRADQRITHVGVALGGGRMAHSALLRGGMAIEQMDATDEYTTRLRAQCVAVRRIL